MADEQAAAVKPRHRRNVGMTARALGVVFGDIGTSPLYALQTVFSADGFAVKATESDVFGVISLVFWTITLVVTIEFVIFIMRADNDGEGGIMALIALVQTAVIKRPRVKPALVAAGLFGVALFFGDGMITPAISVMSAVSGLQVAAPAAAHLVVPITVAVLTGLFMIQRFGTGLVGRLFGPVMVIWFIIIGLAGLLQLTQDASMLKALLPTYAFSFFVNHLGISFIALGSIVLTITGTEALYADMGHFGRPAISRAWFLLVFPTLTLNYMGQGSLILKTPSSISNPFFLLFPNWAQLPMVILATVATVIASQAVISGAFSVAKQATRLGFMPRMTIKQTSNTEIGQVYAPAINWGLFAAVVALVVGFGSSAALASAYGIAVTGTLTIDTILFLVVVRKLWQKPLWLVWLAGIVFLTVNSLFLAANMTKILHGGWFPVAIGVILLTVMLTWNRGRKQVTGIRAEREGSLRDFLHEIETLDPPVTTVPGTAVYLNAHRETAPMALRGAVNFNHAIHEQIVILSIETTKSPFVDDEERLSIDDIGYAGDNIVHLTARLGFKDTPDVPHLLALAKAEGLDAGIDVEHAAYFLSHLDVVPGGPFEMARWRKRIYCALSRNASSPTDYFCLPADRTITVGSQLEL
ncbi:MAG: potassium transporter Kup [Solirubrobacteraceae bacterium]|nr:potassium transporter Kup [Solirubrobacteraceae bacterium]